MARTQPPPGAPVPPSAPPPAVPPPTPTPVAPPATPPTTTTAPTAPVVDNRSPVQKLWDRVSRRSKSGAMPSVKDTRRRKHWLVAFATVIALFCASGFIAGLSTPLFVFVVVVILVLAFLVWTGKLGTGLSIACGVIVFAFLIGVGTGIYGNPHVKTVHTPASLTPQQKQTQKLSCLPGNGDAPTLASCKNLLDQISSNEQGFKQHAKFYLHVLEECNTDPTSDACVTDVKLFQTYADQDQKTADKDSNILGQIKIHLQK